MGQGMIRTSSGRTLMLTPAGWVDQDGNNLNQTMPLSSLLSQQAMPSDQTQSGTLSQPVPVQFQSTPQMDMRRPIDYMGRKGFEQADGRILDADGALIADRNGVGRMEAEDRAMKQQYMRAQIAEMMASAKEKESKSGSGTVPAGYRMKMDGTMEAIPGGPADLKREGQFNQDVATRTATESAMNRLAEEANAVKTAPGLGGITGIRGMLPDIPGTDAANARAKLDTLKSQVAFGVLQAMRDASKTGGALGAVSEKELKLLESNLAALNTAQSKEEFQKALDQIVKYTDEAKARSAAAFNMKHGNEAPRAATPAASIPIGTVRGGYIYVGGDPGQQSSWKVAK